MKLKRLVIMSILALSILTTTSCGLQKVKAGYVGIRVNLYGSNKGVNQQVLGVGKYWIGINEELYLYPTFMQNYVWTKNKAEGSPNDESISFQTTEGLECSADFGISYSIDVDQVSILFQKYRKGVVELTDIVLRNIVRDTITYVSSTYSVQDVYGKGKSRLMEEVNTKVKLELENSGIILDKIYLIGKISIPSNVETALNAKIEATQKAMMRENELREAEAEAKKKVAKAKGDAESNRVRAEGEASANRAKNSTVTPLLLEYEKIQVQKALVDKWNGVSPTTVLGSDGNIILPLK